MVESADPQDDDYLLRHLDRTVFRVRASASMGVRPAPGSLEELILLAVREHPGTTVATLWESVPRLHAQDYRVVQQAVVDMIEERTLERAGQAPLETVDPRYERVPHCAVCGAASDTHPILFWKHNTPVVQCAGCGLIYANPRRQAGYRIANRGESDGTYGVEERVRPDTPDPARLAAWCAGLQRLAAGQPPGRLLDVGEGTREFLATATAEGWAAFGNTSAAEGAAPAEQTYPLPVYTGSLDSAPWPAGWFDAVTLWDMIDQQPSPRALLAQVARLLRPGGRLMLTTPNMRSLSYARWGRTWPVINPSARLYYFAPQTLARLLAESGFTVETMIAHGPAQETWQQMLPFPRLQTAITRLHPLAQGIAQRLLVGDTLQVLARRSPSETPPAASAASSA